MSVLFRWVERLLNRRSTHLYNTCCFEPARGLRFGPTLRVSDCSCQQTARPSSDSDHQSEMAFRFPQGDVENSVLSSYVRVKYIGTQIKSGFFSSTLFKKPLSYKHFKMTCNENTSKVDTNALDYLPFSLTHL